MWSASTSCAGRRPRRFLWVHSDDLGRPRLEVRTLAYEDSEQAAMTAVASQPRSYLVVTSLRRLDDAATAGATPDAIAHGELQEPGQTVTLSEQRPVPARYQGGMYRGYGYASTHE